MIYDDKVESFKKLFTNQIRLNYDGSISDISKDEPVWKTQNASDIIESIRSFSNDLLQR